MISKEKIKSSVDEAIELLKPVVKEVESSIPTTKNHYGEYMGIISSISEKFQSVDDSLTLRVVIGRLLIKAGANSEGVQDALRLM